MSFNPSDLLDHPSGLADVNPLIRQNWRTINNWINAAYDLTASQATTTVTASSALFTSDNAGDIIVFDTGETATIQATGLTSTPATTCVVDTSQTVASSTFSIYRDAQNPYTLLARGLFKGTTVFWADGIIPQWNTAKNRFVPTAAPGYGVTAGQILFGGGAGQPMTSSADFTFNNTTKILAVAGDITATKGITLGVTAQTASTGTTTLDCATGNFFDVTVAAATMITLTNISAGREIHIVLRQNGTGGYAVTFDTMFNFFRTPKINTGANEETHIVGLPRTGSVVEAYAVEDTIRRGGETGITGNYGFSGNLEVGGVGSFNTKANFDAGYRLYHELYPRSNPTHTAMLYWWTAPNGQFSLIYDCDFSGVGGVQQAANLFAFVFNFTTGDFDRVEWNQNTRFNGTSIFYDDITLSGASTDLTLSHDPTAAMQAATKQYVDAVASGVRGVKDGCRVASTADVTIAGPGAAIDGVTLANGDRVLLRAQSTGSQNGIYVFNGAASAMTRSTDFDASAEVISGLLIAVSEGTTYADTLFMLTTNDPITLGTTSLSFALFSASGETNTASNVGAGGQVFKTKSGVDLVFRSIVAGTRISVTQNADDLTIAVTGTIGDVVGPASAVDSNIALFDTTTGKLIKDSGKALPTGAIVGLTDTQKLTNKEIITASNAQTGTTYTTVLTDSSKLVTLSNASAITLTVPPNSSVAYDVGATISLLQLGAGQVTVAPGAGVTISSRGAALKIAGQYGMAVLHKIATDTWILAGDITT